MARSGTPGGVRAGQGDGCALARQVLLSTAMSWETRWREMVLAGGSVVVAACSGGQGGTRNSPGGGALTAECIPEEACQREGGVYDPYTLYAPDGSIGSSPSCTLPSADGGGD